MILTSIFNVSVPIRILHSFLYLFDEQQNDLKWEWVMHLIQKHKANTDKFMHRKLQNEEQGTKTV